MQVGATRTLFKSLSTIKHPSPLPRQQAVRRSTRAIMVSSASGVVLPRGVEPLPATDQHELERVVASLKAKAPQWVGLPPPTRASLLRACLPTLLATVPGAAAAGEAAKGSYGSGRAEEALNWTPIAICLRELAEAMEAGGAPPTLGSRRRPDGQWVVDVFPSGLERLLNAGFRGSVWVTPGQEPTQGALYARKAAGVPGPDAGVALVLGAGNQVSVAACDILHKLVVDDQVVVCKMNPVNEYMGPFVAAALAPLVQAGYVAVVYGGGEVGRALCTHPDVDSIHLTGAAATYDAIVWQGKPKVGDPPCTKHVGAELGCVTPYIITPGPWTDAELAYHADTVASALILNAGHNCLKVELVVTDAAWELRPKFLDALRAKLAACPRRVAYYPTSDEKFQAFRERFPEGVEELGLESGPGTSPWLFKAGQSVDSVDAQHENWCGVLQEVALEGTGGDPAAFLRAAVEFANERVWGTLSAGLIIHPATKAAHSEAFDAAVAELRYGAIAINCPTTMCFVNTCLPWGGYPGSTPQDIGSGNCYVHNTKLIDHPQKGVLEAPWTVRPKPFWATQNPSLEGMAPAALKFFAYPTVWNMIKVIWKTLV
uniref:Aldehyde dehydrogenase domain-containing protein n=1 Tax=Auxenochlorella protothecoides TaxID=3075 RepID=A0A1D2A582_AUXPR